MIIHAFPLIDCGFISIYPSYLVLYGYIGSIIHKCYITLSFRYPHFLFYYGCSFYPLFYYSFYIYIFLSCCPVLAGNLWHVVEVFSGPRAREHGHHDDVEMVCEVLEHGLP